MKTSQIVSLAYYIVDGVIIFIVKFCKFLCFLIMRE